MDTKQVTEQTLTALDDLQKAITDGSKPELVFGLLTLIRMNVQAAGQQSK